MKHDANKMFVAVAVTFAVIWIICAVLVWAVPTVMTALTGHMVHLDLKELVWSMTAAGFFIGLVSWSLLSGVIAWVIVLIYNRLLP